MEILQPMRSDRSRQLMIKFIFTTLLWIVFFTYNIPDTNDYSTKSYDEIIIKQETPEQIHHTPPIHESSEEIINSLYELFTPYRSERDYLTLTPALQATHIERVCHELTTLCKSIVFTQPWAEDQTRLWITLWTIITIQKYRIWETIWFDALHGIHIKNDPDASRWYANHNHIVINYANMSVGEYREVLTHEIWHIIDLWKLQWKKRTYNTQYTEFNKIKFAIDDPSLEFYALSWDSETIRKPWSNKNEFCGLYALKNPFEDIAECINLYLNHNNYFQSIAQHNTILQKKYDIISQWFDPPTTTRATTPIYRRSPTHRYRDTTKITNN